MVVITGLDKVQVEIQVMRVLGCAGPNIVGLRAVLADPASDDLFLGTNRIDDKLHVSSLFSSLHLVYSS